jgi:hypothetical protein
MDNLSILPHGYTVCDFDYAKILRMRMVHLPSHPSHKEGCVVVPG